MTEALRKAQRLMFHMGHAVGPDDGILGPKTLTGLLAVASGRAADDTMRQVAAALVVELARTFGPDLRLPLMHFIAQAAHETMGFRRLYEIWGPTAAQNRYEGRKDLGNTQPGDGFKFRGRGIFQLTGRANYHRLSLLTDLPLTEQPELAAEPGHSARIACLYWQASRITPLAQKDDLKAVTRRINGGLNGLADREACLRRLKAVWS